MPRSDLSNYLVHWTKGHSYEQAFDVLRVIVHEGRLLGSSTMIRGGYSCVCFTETPEATFHQVAGKYKPFGIQIPKAWLFERGGRPVIYQTSDEYDLLPEAVKWRHMRYEPHTNLPFDFSWEREWRIHTNELMLDWNRCRILVPEQMWADLLIDDHEETELETHYLMSTAFGEEWLQAPIEEFKYKYAVIDV